MRSSQLNGRGHNGAAGLGMDRDAHPGGMLDDPHVSYQMNPLQVLTRRLWVVAAVACVVVGLATGFTFMQTPTYMASVTILIGQKGEAGAEDNLISEAQGVQSIAETVITAITTVPVAEGVVQELDRPVPPSSVLAGLTAEQIGTSQFVVVSYEDTDPRRAQLVANTVGDVFSKQIADVSSDANSLSATVWEEAALPASPVSPDLRRNVLLALVLGLMLGVGLAFLLEHLDDDWKSPEEVERVAGVPTFGVIPAFKIRKNKRRAS